MVTEDYRLKTTPSPSGCALGFLTINPCNHGIAITCATNLYVQDTSLSPKTSKLCH